MTAPKVRPCLHCGLIHDMTCPRIKSIEYFEDGHIKALVFHDPDPIDLKVKWQPSWSVKFNPHGG